MDLLQSFLSMSLHTKALTAALSRLKFIHNSILTEDLEYLKELHHAELQPRQPQSSETKCGMKLYSMVRDRGDMDFRFLRLKMLKSKVL
jgi:hypothetical protein